MLNYLDKIGIGTYILMGKEDAVTIVIIGTFPTEDLESFQITDELQNHLTSLLLLKSVEYQYKLYLQQNNHHLHCIIMYYSTT